jgi:MFS family permease
MFNIRDHFNIFTNKKMDSLYFSVAMVTFGEGLINIFVPIYLWQMNFEFWQILYFYFLKSFFFVVLTFLALPLMKRMSDKMIMFSGIPFLILYFLFLSGGVSSVSPVFYLVAALGSAGGVFYNFGFHLIFAHSAQDGHLGREVGARYMTTSLASFAGPLAGGYLIFSLGFSYTFIIAGAIMFLSVAPFFFFPTTNISHDIGAKAVLGFFKDKSILPFNLSGLGYAAETMIGGIIWPIFIFLTIKNIENVGGIASVASFGGLIVTYFVGFLSDIGKRRKLMAWATVAFSLMWILRLFVSGRTEISLSHIFANTIYAAMIVCWVSQFYKISRSVACPELFILSREILYNVARVIVLPFLMWLSFLLPAHTFYRTSFILAAIFSLSLLFANRQHVSDIDGKILAKK